MCYKADVLCNTEGDVDKERSLIDHLLSAFVNGLFRDKINLSSGPSPSIFIQDALFNCSSWL